MTMTNIPNEQCKVCDEVAQWLVTCPSEWITAWHAGFESQLDGWTFHKCESTNPMTMTNIPNEQGKVCDEVAQWLVTCPEEWLTARGDGFKPQSHQVLSSRIKNDDDKYTKRTL